MCYETGRGKGGRGTIRVRPLPTIDHSLVQDNLWIVISICVGAGGVMGEIAGFLHGNLGCGFKLMIIAGAALMIFGAIWFFAPTSS